MAMVARGMATVVAGNQQQQRRWQRGLRMSDGNKGDGDGYGNGDGDSVNVGNGVEALVDEEDQWV
jgi:hypothetical protein